MSEQKTTDQWKVYKCSCGKGFIPRPNWMYKLRINGKLNYFCSYTCYHNAGGDGGKRVWNVLNTQ